MGKIEDIICLCPEPWCTRVAKLKELDDMFCLDPPNKYQNPHCYKLDAL